MKTAEETRIVRLIKENYSLSQENIRLENKIKEMRKGMRGMIEELAKLIPNSGQRQELLSMAKELE